MTPRTARSRWATSYNSREDHLAQPGEDYCNVSAKACSRRRTPRRIVVSAINTGVMLRANPGDERSGGIEWQQLPVRFRRPRDLVVNTRNRSYPSHDRNTAGSRPSRHPQA